MSRVLQGPVKTRTNDERCEFLTLVVRLSCIARTGLILSPLGEPECQKREKSDERESERVAESRGLERERQKDQANIECRDMRWIS